MIPRIIHYCWFGGNPLPEMAKKCVESWKKFCPDYEIIEWNESNFDLNYCPYVKEAFENRKWAFITDVVRLYALVNCGGIYMDTDVEVIKPLDYLLQFKAVSGFESEDRIPTGLMAAEKGHPFFVELLHEYDDIHFITNGEMDFTTNVTRISRAALRHGLVLNNTMQTVAGFTLLPNDYLCPKNYKTHELTLTNNSLCIHHFDGSWLSDEAKYRKQLANKISKVFPYRISSLIAGVVSSLRYQGFIKTCSKITQKIVPQKTNEL